MSIHIQTLENNKKHRGYLLLVLWYTFSFHAILWLRITHTKTIFRHTAIKKVQAVIVVSAGIETTRELVYNFDDASNGVKVKLGECVSVWECHKMVLICSRL